MFELGSGVLVPLLVLVLALVCATLAGVINFYVRLLWHTDRLGSIKVRGQKFELINSIKFISQMAVLVHFDWLLLPRRFMIYGRELNE